MLLNENENLVRAPAPRSKSTTSAQIEAAAPVALDPRVGGNIRLGDDPSQLPSNQRAQAEPHISRSQTDPDFLAATFQEGRFTNGMAVDCGYSISHDGGLNWSRALIPGLTQVVGGPYYRATDPVAGIALNGNVYLNTDAATDSTADHAVLAVSRSTDGGATFQSPVIAYTPPSAAYFPDKNWMAVNTFANTPTAGRIVVTFTRFRNLLSPIARTFSDDGGLTWSPAVLLSPSTSYMQGTQPVFLPDGKLVIVYWNFHGAEGSGGGNDTIEAIASSNGGTTFGSPRLVTAVPEIHSESPTIRTGVFLPSATGDRTTQNVYVAYQARVAGAPKILFTKSTDAGTTWSAPIPISDNPAGSGVFNPAIAASPDGETLTAVFYDHRANPGTNTLVDLYMAQSFDSGATWQPNIRLTSVSTDVTLAPYVPNAGYMIGDYLGVAESTNRNVPAVPVFIDTRTGNPDPFIARVGIAPTPTLASWEAARLPFNEITDPQFVHSGIQLNISTRGFVQPGDSALIGGFIITGNQPKDVVIRGIGPSLGSSGVQGALANPTLELHRGSSTLAVNNDWKDTQQSQIEATTIPPSNDLESATVQRLDPGVYTAVVRGKDNGSGIGLVEVFDLSRNSDSELANISTRGFVGTGDNVMIGGFIVGAGATINGTGSGKFVVRALGPSLQSAVANALQDPTLELHDANGVLFAANDDWTQGQPAEVQSFDLAPADQRECAIVAIVPEGNYTAIVRGKNNGTGVALVEVYNVH
jgi:hypothetical protein